VDDEPTLAWIRAMHATTTWTTSVCTGALLLGAAALLEGLDATTHWRVRASLTRFGANPGEDRVVERGRIIACAGVSAGIDMALVLAARLSDDLTAQAIQLAIEYDPQPPHDSGSVAAAGPAVIQRLEQLTRG
jgi:transcriptional regulator GlxA family with amidase domain